MAGEVQDARLRDGNPRQDVHDLDADPAGALGRGEKSAGCGAGMVFLGEKDKDASCGPDVPVTVGAARSMRVKACRKSAASRRSVSGPPAASIAC